MRLTEDKYNCDSYSLKELNIPAGTEYFAIQKLGQLEDIEEELGINLITFFKALENGVYAFNKKKNIVKGYIAIAYDNGDFENYLRFVLPDRLNCDELHFKDYGKTWALTKEELENGN